MPSVARSSLDLFFEHLLLTTTGDNGHGLTLGLAPFEVLQNTSAYPRIRSGILLLLRCELLGLPVAQSLCL